MCYLQTVVLLLNMTTAGAFLPPVYPIYQQHPKKVLWSQAMNHLACCKDVLKPKHCSMTTSEQLILISMLQRYKIWSVPGILCFTATSISNTTTFATLLQDVHSLSDRSGIERVNPMFQNEHEEELCFLSN